MDWVVNLMIDEIEKADLAEADESWKQYAKEYHKVIRSFLFQAIDSTIKKYEVFNKGFTELGNTESTYFKEKMN